MFAIAVAIALAAAAGRAAEPEPAWALWDELLQRYSDPARGMDYAGLRREERPRLEALRRELAAVDAARLGRDERLAFFINLYNVNVVAIVVDAYPVRSIRELSTDPIIRLNVFKKPLVPLGDHRVSLDHIEHEIVRPEFRDPRIHFALNCAARSCPPLREEAYRGDRLHEQLDEQVRRFAAAGGVRVERRRGRTVVTTTRILDWFAEDFEAAGGKLAFLLPYLPPDTRKLLPRDGAVRIEYDHYDWSLNDWRR